MLMGIKFHARPNKQQAATLCSWMGAAKFIWNAKCDEDRYLRTFARKYLPLDSWPPLDQAYAQYKSKELSAFLNDCPSQILRNSASNWYSSYQEFFKQKDRGRPRRKKKGQGMSILLTKELFQFRNIAGQLKLFIGAKKNNIGILDVNWHSKTWKKHGIPKSIRLKKLPSGKFTVSFCYGEEDGSKHIKEDKKNWLKYLKEHKTKEELDNIVLGIDRGINIAVATDQELIKFSPKSLNGLIKYKKLLKKQQIKLARQKNKDSKRRNKRRLKVAQIHKKISDIRDNECHHISRKLVDMEQKVFVLEDLHLKNMSKSAKGTQENPGRKVKAKSGLNRELLNMGLYKIASQLEYKARLCKKIVFKINPSQTSQECANCGHTHSENRSGIKFKCLVCGHEDHADSNAAKIIKIRAVKLFLNSGTELSDKGVLLPKDKGRRAKIRPLTGNPKKGIGKNRSNTKETSKKIGIPFSLDS